MPRPVPHLVVVLPLLGILDLLSREEVARHPLPFLPEQAAQTMKRPLILCRRQPALQGKTGSGKSSTMSGDNGDKDFGDFGSFEASEPTPGSGAAASPCDPSGALSPEAQAAEASHSDPFGSHSPFDATSPEPLSSVAGSGAELASEDVSDFRDFGGFASAAQPAGEDYSFGGFGAADPAALSTSKSTEDGDAFDGFDAAAIPAVVETTPVPTAEDDVFGRFDVASTAEVSKGDLSGGFDASTPATILPTPKPAIEDDTFGGFDASIPAADSPTPKPKPAAEDDLFGGFDAAIPADDSTTLGSAAEGDAFDGNDAATAAEDSSTPEPATEGNALGDFDAAIPTAATSTPEPTAEDGDFGGFGTFASDALFSLPQSSSKEGPASDDPLEILVNDPSLLINAEAEEGSGDGSSLALPAGAVDIIGAVNGGGIGDGVGNDEFGIVAAAAATSFDGLEGEDITTLTSSEGGQDGATAVALHAAAFDDAMAFSDKIDEEHEDNAASLSVNAGGLSSVAPGEEIVEASASGGYDVSCGASGGGSGAKEGDEDEQLSPFVNGPSDPRYDALTEALADAAAEAFERKRKEGGQGDTSRGENQASGEGTASTSRGRGSGSCVDTSGGNDPEFDMDGNPLARAAG